MSALNGLASGISLTVSKMASSVIHSGENRPPVVLSVTLKWILLESATPRLKVRVVVSGEVSLPQSVILIMRI